MAGYRRYAKGKNSYFKSKSCTKPTKKLAKFVRNVVAASTAITVRRPRTDPPNIKLDRPFKRLVRIQIAPEDTLLYSKTVFNTEAGYYGITASGQGGTRWTHLKVLAATFYGVENINAIAVNIIASGDVPNTRFTDTGDLNHRPCIKVIMPPTTTAKDFPASGNGSTLFGFEAGTIDFIDVYVEFS